MFEWFNNSYSRKKNQYLDFQSEFGFGYCSSLRMYFGPRLLLIGKTSLSVLGFRVLKTVIVHLCCHHVTVVKQKGTLRGTDLGWLLLRRGTSNVQVLPPAGSL